MIEPTQPTPPDDALLTRALRKASIRLLPLIALGYGTAYMDRVNISFAAPTMNLDLHLSSTVYGLGAGLFFLSYAACEVPSNLLLYRFGARRWLSRIMITWAVIAMGMIFVRTPIQFYAARFLLGIAEAGFFPGVVFYLTQWFPPSMRARAIARFYVAFPLSTVVMGLVAGALLNLNGRAHLAGWQWLFLVEAAPALVLGIVFLRTLPDTPAHARWLTPAEREVILTATRLAEAPQRHSILDTLRDARVLLLGIFTFCMLGSGYAASFYAPTIVQRLTGTTIANAGFVIAAMNAMGAIAMLTVAVFSDRAGRRAAGDPVLPAFRFVVPACLVMASGFVALGGSSRPGIALGGLLAIVVGNFAMQGPVWAICTSLFTGRSGAAAIAAINMVGILGGFAGPYWMGFARDLTGDYQRGLLTMAAPMLMAATIMVWLSRRWAHSRSTQAAGEAVPSLP